MRRHGHRSTTWRGIAAAAGLVLASGTALGQALKGNFGEYMAQAVLCGQRVDTAYAFAMLRQQVGPPYKQEQGAHWWKVKLNIHGVQATEVFVADSSYPYQFVGALLKQSPDAAAPVLSARGPTFTKAPANDPYRPLPSATGSMLLWQDRLGKLVCVRQAFGDRF